MGNHMEKLRIPRKLLSSYCIFEWFSLLACEEGVREEGDGDS